MQQSPLKSITEEAAACRAAFEGIEVGAIVQHCHHEQWLEILDEPAENRIHYILTEKANHERAARLRLFRPLAAADAKRLPRKLGKASAERDKARAEWYKASAEWDKAGAEWDKAGAEWYKAGAELGKASAEWDKASAEWYKASAEWGKAGAELGKASAEWGKAGAGKKLHAKLCGCLWSGVLDIFGEAR